MITRQRMIERYENAIRRDPNHPAINSWKRELEKYKNMSDAQFHRQQRSGMIAQSKARSKAKSVTKSGSRYYVNGKEVTHINIGGKRIPIKEYLEREGYTQPVSQKQVAKYYVDTPSGKLQISKGLYEKLQQEKERNVGREVVQEAQRLALAGTPVIMRTPDELAKQQTAPATMLPYSPNPFAMMGVFEQAMAQYEQAEQWAREHVTKSLPEPNFLYSEENIERTWQHIKRYDPAGTGGHILAGADLPKEMTDTIRKTFMDTSNISSDDPILSEYGARRVMFLSKMYQSKGHYEGIKEYPIKTSILFGVSFAVPHVTKGLGFIGKTSGFSGFIATHPKASLLSQTIEKTIAIGLGGAYLHGTGSRIRSKKSWAEQQQEMGRISATEIEPMAFGGLLGHMSADKIQGYLRSRGLKKIPTEKLVPEDVLTGKHRFPEKPKSLHRYSFEHESTRLPDQTEPMMFHATGYPPKTKGGEFIVGKGSSEFEGLYGSYGVSPHFLRTGQSYKVFGTNLINYKEPTVFAIKPTKFVSGKSARLGEAFIPTIKPEVEAVIPPETIIKTFGSKYFFDWKGVRVPIIPSETVGGKVTGLVKGLGILPSESYYVPSSESLISPLTLIPSVLISGYSKPSRSIPTPSSYRFPYDVSISYISTPPSRKVSPPPTYRFSSGGTSSGSGSEPVSPPSSPILSSIVYGMPEKEKKAMLTEDFGFFDETKRKHKVSKQPRKYRASFGAMLMGITAKKKPERVTGVEPFRPMLSKRKKAKSFLF